jgi:site-specific DNA-methyltransferase (adenine-specific)
MAWLAAAASNTIHAVCTDPPYGVVEFTEKELAKLRAGRGGIWRLPPRLNGVERDPLPRFTVLTEQERQGIEDHFFNFGKRLLPVVVPGGHVCIAGNSILQHYVQRALGRAGFEVRTTIIRLYRGFRGGDRPKNAELEFPEVCVTARGNYEPWMLFRKPLSEKTVAQNLRKWGTGGLRRLNAERPFPDVIVSGKTPKREEAISSHPCLKPQHFMRLVTRSLLPLGEGVVLDPFMGAGSTIAAAECLGYESIGIERDQVYYEEAVRAVPCLAALYPRFKGDVFEMELAGPGAEFSLPAGQLTLVNV